MTGVLKGGNLYIDTDTHKEDDAELTERMSCEDDELKWCIFISWRTLVTIRARNGQGQILPCGFQASMALLTTWFQTSSFQNREIINFYYVKPFSLWYFVVAALGNYSKPPARNKYKCRIRNFWNSNVLFVPSFSYVWVTDDDRAPRFHPRAE